MPDYDPVAISETLNRHGVAYVVIGGFAATAWGNLLPTVDVDVTPESSSENLERLPAVLSDIDAVFGWRGSQMASPSCTVLTLWRRSLCST